MNNNKVKMTPITKMSPSRKLATCCLMLALVACFATSLTLAGQGCPFDDGSCQEYCNQQGCNMGYCGHFAWIQCICRKCGDEWSWYDKVRYNPDKTVNQTELDSLKLNGTSPLILTNSPQDSSSAKRASGGQLPVLSQQQQQQQQKKPATLTTLLIPDLSDNSKLSDLNDIPDENSDKFLDYIAKNHEKLVQATSARDNAKSQQDQAGSGDESTEEEPSEQQLAAQEGDETVEIQISSSNNNTSGGDVATAAETTTKPAAEQLASNNQPQPQPQQQPDATRPVTRLLKMAVVERASDEID